MERKGKKILRELKLSLHRRDTEWINIIQEDIILIRLRSDCFVEDVYADKPDELYS